MRRYIPALLALAVLAGVLLLLWQRQPAVLETPPPAGSPTAAHVAAAPGQVPAPTIASFRLAGVAAGGQTMYAAIEDPHGVSALYRLGDEVAGLGRVAEIAPQQVRIETAGGPLVMRLQPAPTKSPTVTRQPRTTPVTPVPAAATSPAGSALESLP